MIRDLAHAPTAGGGAALRADLRPGDLVGRFEVIGEVGRGGFGVVYQARDPKLRRTVALKLIHPGLQGARGEDRLLQEAELAARLSHPNVVTLYDVGRSDAGHFLVMDFLRGQTLAARLQQGPVPVEEALRIGLAIAEGLAHAHSQGIVHRDLKPANVFLTERGGVKILDLGMAYAFGRRRLEGGTPGSMAPEQQRGAPEDERTDVYALGAILAWMLSGRPPAAKVPAPGPPKAPGLPGLAPLLLAMLQPDPVHRPRHAGEVVEALESLLREAAPEAPAPSNGASTARWRVGPEPRGRLARRAWTALAVAGLLGLGLAGWRTYRGAAAPAGAAYGAGSIAVLPFEDLGPTRDRAQAVAFSDGLRAALGRVEGLRVPGPSAPLAAAGVPPRLADLGRALGVSTVLEGSVLKEGARLRITARMIDVASGYQRWSETYDGGLDELPSFEEEITRAVAGVLGVPPPRLSRSAPPAPSGSR